MAWKGKMKPQVQEPATRPIPPEYKGPAQRLADKIMAIGHKANVPASLSQVPIQSGTSKAPGFTGNDGTNYS